MEDWKECLLGDVCFYGKNKISVSDLSKETYISTENMLPNRGGITTAATLPTGEQTPSFDVGDTLVSNIRPYFKKIWKATFSGGCSADVLNFKVKENISKDYLYYILSDDEFFKYCMATSKGTKMPRGDKLSIMNYKLSLPPLSVQKKIAAVLSSLDDKIELNRQINANLEQQAQAIFKEISKSAGEKIKLANLCEIKGGKRLPKGVNLTMTKNTHPYIRVRDLNNVSIISLNDDFEYVDDETQKHIANYIVKTNDVLISIVGTIGLVAIIDETLNNANLTENCVKLTNINKTIPEYLYLYLKSKEGQEQIKKGTVGAVQSKLPIKNIQEIIINLGEQELFEKYKKDIQTIFQCIKLNQQQSRILASIRDALLPKLMSGELHV